MSSAARLLPRLGHDLVRNGRPIRVITQKVKWLHFAIALPNVSHPAALAALFNDSYLALQDTDLGSRDVTE
jgi:hypothetical protein